MFDTDPRCGYSGCTSRLNQDEMLCGFHLIVASPGENPEAASQADFNAQVALVRADLVRAVLTDMPAADMVRRGWTGPGGYDDEDLDDLFWQVEDGGLLMARHGNEWMRQGSSIDDFAFLMVENGWKKVSVLASHV